MNDQRELDELLAEAERRPVGGWDFGWLGARMSTTDPLWDFEEIVVRRARESPDLLEPRPPEHAP